MESCNLLMISIMESKYINLGISQLTGYLRNRGFTVDMLFFHDGESNEYIMSQIGCRHTHYAFSVSQTNFSRIVKFVKNIKARDINAIVIFGGPFSSMYYEDISNDVPEVDYFVLGDGEIPTEYLLSGGQIEGYPYIYSPKHSSSSYQQYHNEDISWDIADDYFLSDGKKRHIHSIISKNNVCSGSCTFCCIEKSSHIVYKPVDIILTEILKYNNSYGVSHFYFIDNDLFDPGNETAKERIAELCDKLIKLGRDLHFYCSAKATAFRDTQSDHTLLEKMYLAGFDSVFFGIEAANDDDLKLYNKKNRVADNYLSLQLLREHKIHPDIGFICFNPYSTLSRIKENFKFLIDAQIEDITHYTQSFLEIYKGSPFYTLAVKQQLLNKQYNYMHLDEYRFVSEDAEKITQIVMFLKEKFKNNKEFLTEDGWARFAVFFNGLRRHNKDLEVYVDEFDNLKQKYIDLLRSYFSKLYLDGDIQYCRYSYNDFLKEYRRNKKEMHQLRTRIILSNIRSSKPAPIISYP